MSDGDISLDKLPEYIDSLKATIAQQAQEIERLKVELEECKHQNGISARESELEQQLAASQARCAKFEAIVCDHQDGACNRTIVQLQATLAAREAELHACQSNLKQSELERDAAVQEVERLKKEYIRYKLECYDVRRQLAASQERARELEGEIVKHRPKSECYDRVCQSLGISHDILGHVATLQATLAEREAEIEQARVQLSGCLVAAEGGTKDSAKQGDYGWSVAYQATLDLRVRYDSAVQEAGRALKGRH